MEKYDDELVAISDQIRNLVYKAADLSNSALTAGSATKHKQIFAGDFMNICNTVGDIRTIQITDVEIDFADNIIKLNFIK